VRVLRGAGSGIGTAVGCVLIKEEALMKKKKTGKAKTVRGLPAKALRAKSASDVRGGSRKGSAKKGSELPSENISLSYGQIKWNYTE
jgi:hypothetical protein